MPRKAPPRTEAQQAQKAEAEQALRARRLARDPERVEIRDLELRLGLVANHPEAADPDLKGAAKKAALKRVADWHAAERARKEAARAAEL